MLSAASRRAALLALGIALVYVLAARLGWLLAIGPAHLVTVWPAAGVAVAAMMLQWRRAVPGLAIGMLSTYGAWFMSRSAASFATDALAAAALTVASLVQSGLAARALLDFESQLRQHPVRQTLRFIMTVVLCCVIDGSVGQLVRWATGGARSSDLFFGWITLWLGDVIGILVVAPGMLLLLHPQLRRDRLAVQAFPLVCLGLGLTLFSAFAVGLADRDAHIERFRADAGRLAMAMQNHVELAGRDLETLQHYFYKVDLDAAEFRAVSTPLLQRSPWQSTFEWLPRVTNAQRDAFELAPDGLSGMSIREVQADDSVVRAARRAEYFPVAWTDPESGQEALVGLDHAADPRRGTALQLARREGRFTATPPLSSVAYSPEGRVVQTLYAPINDKSVGAGVPFDPARVRGMAAATVDIAMLLQVSLDQMAIHDQTVLLYDPDAPDSAALQWSDGVPIRIVDPQTRAQLVEKMAGGTMRLQWLKVADRRWGLLARPAWASTMPQPGWLQTSVLGSGLVFTTLLTGFLVVRRRRDEALQDSRDRLEQQVLTRTQDLASANRQLVDEIVGHRHTEELLRDARQKAESANRAKSMFLANMSHEIRTPLNAVLGYTQLLMEDARQPGDSRERLRIIYAAGQRLLGLINDVLDLAKIEAGGLHVHLRPLDLRRELEEIMTLFEPRARAKGLAMVSEFDVDGGRVLVGDRAKLGQIVLNLLGNALKFTDNGRIVLRAWRSAGDTLVEVEDTGPGMDADELAGVFTAFSQGAAGLAKGGTGLGLNLSQSIARALGGELTVDSTRGVGTRVRLRLPMAPADADAAAVSTDLAPAAALEVGRRLAPGTTCRVLVVEDDAHSRDVLATLLRETGCDVQVAVDGQAGLDACLAAADAGGMAFSILFSDIRMPRLDGLQMLHALRADPRTQAWPAIAVSASSFEHERRYYVGEGFQDFVGKPYAFADIHAMLVRYAGVTLVAAPAADADAANVEADSHAASTAVDDASAVGPNGHTGADPTALRALLAALADSAAQGIAASVRPPLAAIAALASLPTPDGASALPDGLLQQLEADLRQYDFGALETRVRRALEMLERLDALNAK